MTHYIDGFLLPIAPEKIAEYQKMASLAGSVWKEHGALAYWEEPYLANAMATANWLEFEEYSWGDYVEVWDNPQFDSNGYPRYLNEGRYLRAIINGLHGAGPLHRGHVVLTWQGSGDLRLSASSEEYLATESSGAMTGSLERRVEKTVRETVEPGVRQICRSLPALMDSQQGLSASLPSFRPYATLEADDVEDCEREVRREFATR